MRINKFIALHTSYSRRAADNLIDEGRVKVDGSLAISGQLVNEGQTITIDEEIIKAGPNKLFTIIMNKPTGYVCSRKGQGSRTIYDLLTEDLKHLNSVGRLDKNSSGLILLTNDGELANQLTHPRYQKTKIYDVVLSKSLQPIHQQMINDFGVMLEDGLSRLQLEKLDDRGDEYRITMHEGRNRQIRRTFSSLGYDVKKLHRVQFGEYKLNDLKSGEYKLVTN